MIGKIQNKALFIAIFLALSACQQGPEYNAKRVYKKLSKEDPRNMHYKGHYKVGEKYKIKNQTYKPKEVTRYTKTGVASWYGDRYGFHGNTTANGDLFNKNLLTAAHRTLQLPSLVKVKNLENNRSIIVLVNDRGPYANNREIDLSERAATILGMKEKGTAKVRVQYLHSESKKLLQTLGLEKKHGSRAKAPMPNKCSVNCQVKLVNLKYKKR
ncbi:MAG: septal ring lytic transglycosylase RlpA family protein [Rickettsiaceae bacterium]|nr:septal ring lytic transglycosylase RlpA family protein [Rickettsiaceae bacterium]